MEITYLIIGLLIGTLITYVLVRINSVSKTALLEAQHQIDLKNHEIETLQRKINDLQISAENNSDQLEDFRLEFIRLEKQHITLQQRYEDELLAKEEQKKYILELQNQNKIYFENLASKILDEKSEKFTLQNSLQLKQILDPFQEKITELKKQVSETYDKESKERFSLESKVKELAELNRQISEEAKRLTNALKGESKTQGNWGEMILESILEKSGLTKGREYFLEHELRDEDNKAIYSEFSGKKMRPDAVVKYPDNRNVIIDAKVSLTAFSEISQENDEETNQLRTHQHLQSVKNHVNELSRKAYDDFDRSLDFVMMFIPSEAAYIVAMQADPNLWSYAYDKRVLLLNPSNLITSLKLIAELWKRDYQNKNAIEIANRGAKLYDKFVGFVENLERVGKTIDAAKNSYNDALKQLHTGKDNLVNQTQKLKELGVKGKKDLPPSLVDQSQINTEE